MTDQAVNKKQSNGLVRVFGYCINKLWLLLASIIIITALVHMLLGVLLPKINLYREEIISWIEQVYDINIEIKEISAEWGAQGPVVALLDLKIKSQNDQYNIIEVGEVSLYFDIITSLWDWRFSTQEILIDQANLKFFIDRKLGVRLDLTGKVIDRSSSIELEETSSSLIDILFGQKQISITDSNLELYTIQGTEFDYHINQIKVEKYEDIHQLSGQLTYGSVGQITLVTEIYGDPRLDDSFSEIYFHGSDINISDIPWLDDYPQAKPSAGELSWQFWGVWKDKHWQEVNSVIDLSNASWANEKKSTVNIDHSDENNNHLSMMFSWQHGQNMDGYLSIHNWQFYSKLVPVEHTNDGVLPEVYAKYQSLENNNISWESITQNFPLESMANYIAAIADPNQSYTQFFKQSNFSLLLDQIYGSIIKQDDKWQSPDIELDFSKLKYSSWNKIPSINGLTGKIVFDHQIGKASLHGQGINLQFTDMFRQDIKAENIEVDFEWSLDENKQLDIILNQFKFSNDSLTLQAKAGLFYQDEQPILSLYTELTDVNLSKLSNVLPVGVMSTGLTEYLDNSIKSGNLSLAKSAIRGPIQHFSLHDNKSVFEAVVNLDNVIYQYLEQWPVITEFDTQLLFEGHRMELVAKTAKSVGNLVLGAQIIAEDLSSDDSMMDLSIEIESFNNSARDLLNQTPIRFIADSLQSVDYSGKMLTKVDLQFGLSGSSETIYSGEVSFDTKHSQIDTTAVIIDHLDGVIAFDVNGLSKSLIKAQYFGKELQIEITGKDKETSPKLSLDIKGILPAEGISDFIGSSWSRYFNGETTFTSKIQFSPNDKLESTRVFFQSELQGMSIDFPDVFGKTTEQKSEINLKLDLDSYSIGEVSWGEIKGKWFWETKDIQKNISDIEIQALEQSMNDKVQDENSLLPIDYGGTFYINQNGEYRLPIRPGLRVRGHLDEIDLMSWLAFINDFGEYPKDVQYDVDEDAIDFSLVFEQLEIDIQKIKTPIVTIANGQLSIKKLPEQPWDIGLLTETQGVIALKIAVDRPWEVSLFDLNLELDKKSSVDKEQQTEIELQAQTYSTILPTEINEMDISCNNCVIQNFDYGDMKLQLRNATQGLEFFVTSAKPKQHDLILSGSWLIDDKGENKTQLNYQLLTPNVGSLLKKWDFDIGVEDSSAEMRANLWWDAKPWQFDYKQIEGDANLKLGKGYLSEISDEKGRIFSLFNLQSLVRKLTFDFKDVYKKGFFYDNITGDFQLRDGIISTENVQVKGNVADVKLYGETDIKNSQIEQLAVVTPHITSSLPVLAAWAIEPTTGLIVYLLNLLMEPAVEVATRIDYRIHGSFDEVQVEQIQTAKKKIKVQYELEQETAVKSEIDKN